MKNRPNSVSKEPPDYPSNILHALNTLGTKVMIAVWDKNGTFESVWVSEEMVKHSSILGCELQGKRLHDVYSAAEAGRIQHHIQKCLDIQSMVRLVSHISSKRGNFWQDLTFVPANELEDTKNVIGIICDITNTRERENELQEEEFVYLKLFSETKDAYIHCSPDGKILNSNKKVWELLEVGSNESIEPNRIEIKDILHPSSSESVNDFWGNFYTKPHEEKQINFLTSGSGSKVFHMSKYIRSDMGSSTPHVHLILRAPDVTKANFDSLRDDKEFLFSILSGIQNTSIQVMDRNGRRVAVSMPESVQVKAGVPSADMVVGSTVEDTNSREEADRIVSMINHVLDTGEYHREEHSFNAIAGKLWHDVTISPIRLSTGDEYAITVHRDITDYKKAEEERVEMERKLHQAQKMEAVGRIGAGIAHDFGNRLSVILGYGTYLKNQLKGQPQAQEKLDKLIRATEEASLLTKQLLTFAQKDVYHNVRLEVHQQIRKAMEILEHSLDKRIKFTLELTAKTRVMMADASQVQNIFFNLILNAADAMPNGGSVKIATENVELAGNEFGLNAFSLSPGCYLKIRITDTGGGINPDDVRHIFEPFYTTKKLGKGTGLGLATVYGTVTHYKGAITVESVLHSGTTFTLYFPVLAGGQEKPVECGGDTGNWVVGQGSVLVVDDEASVLQMMRDCLDVAGYNVTTCGDAVEALKYVRDNPETLDLVILDMMMPVMSGRDLFRAMREMTPSLKVLITSAYSKTGMIEETLKAGAVGFVEKPVTAADFTRVVAKAIKGS